MSIAKAMQKILLGAEITWTYPPTSTMAEALYRGLPLPRILTDAVKHLGVGDSIAQVADTTLDTILGYHDLTIPGAEHISDRAERIGQSFAQNSLAYLAQVEEPYLREIIRRVQAGEQGMDTLLQAVGTTQRKAVRTLNTGLAGIQRVVARELSRAISDGPDILLWYVGPKDSRNRGYCAALTGKVVTEQQLANAPNGQQLPPLVYCGGWSCRHSLIPVNSRIMRTDNLKLATLADYAEAVRAGAENG